jgi:hypothetical protein
LALTFSFFHALVYSAIRQESTRDLFHRTHRRSKDHEQGNEHSEANQESPGENHERKESREEGQKGSHSFLEIKQPGSFNRFPALPLPAREAGGEPIFL